MQNRHFILQIFTWPIRKTFWIKRVMWLVSTETWNLGSSWKEQFISKVKINMSASNLIPAYAVLHIKDNKTPNMQMLLF